MSSDTPEHLSILTRSLSLPPSATNIEIQPTGPLDATTPYVLEFRIVGTPSILQAQIRQSMFIGRADSTGFSPEIDLTDFDGLRHGVSRRHAVILVKDGRLYVRDLNSTNGTRLNNVSCPQDGEARLRHGDEIMVGRMRLQVSFELVPSHLNDTQERTRLADRPRQTEPMIDGAGRRILIVEDDQEVGSALERTLNAVGFQVQRVSNVLQGLGVVFQEMPDAIILDLMLPERNGLDLVRYVRQQPSARHVPLVVMVTTNAGQINQALQAGADRCFSKPVSMADVLDALKDTAAKKKSRLIQS